mgnify:CR=1 FL=1
MPACFIVRAVVHDADAYRAYAERSPGVLARFGGRAPTFEGPEETCRVVIAAFPDVASAGACYRSPDCQALIPLRAGCATFEFILVDGVPPA